MNNPRTKRSVATGKSSTKGPGRRAGLTPELIMTAAEGVIAELGWERFSMRALGRALGVDPMAIYHYFDGREALLAALVERAFVGIDPGDPPFRPDDPWPKRVEAIVERYLRVVTGAPRITMLLLEGIADAAPPVARFRSLVDMALAELHLPIEQVYIISDLLVDYVHGFALAPGAARSEAWRPAVALMVEGIRAVSRGDESP